ncbi:RlpA-like double-psi beta-barrel-protein domain-containing protein-containing protein [Mycena leptocephala]|nr:RlpA-like double-psi beta-barrel-protein domain-containing protein-containing protein [Mycena leptocephala]
MTRLASLALFALSIISLPAITGASAINPSTSRAIAKSQYTKSHSLGDSYTFDLRDGWQTFNASNLQYKYRRESTKKDKKKTSGESALALDKVIAVVKTAVKGMFGIGKQKPAIVTWYTGHDLLNPSCWSNTAWTPTDESFVCALTLKGWDDKPQCLKFLEVCNSPKKCVFVRVVDSCAGCAKNSKHVDLTRGAFSQLGSLDQGVLQVQWRLASDPAQWIEELWGPEK